MSILTIKHISKSYGSVQAVNGLSLSIPKGSVYGILGPNGSGKTTTLGIVLGVIHATKGSFHWFGDIDTTAARKRIGAILETPNFYPYLSARNNLRIVAKIKQIEKSKVEERIDTVLNEVKLLHRGDDAFKTYSLGMRQRLSVASAMLSDPEVLVLDEPTNGLDPQGIAEMRDLIRRIAKGGKTIIIASHILDEVQKVCSHVAILKNGNLLRDGGIDEILGGGDMIGLGHSDLAKLRGAIEKMENIEIIRQDEGVLLVKTTITPEELNKKFFDEGLVLNELSVRKQNLETQFLEITKEQ